MFLDGFLMQFCTVNNISFYTNKTGYEIEICLNGSSVLLSRRLSRLYGLKVMITEILFLEIVMFLFSIAVYESSRPVKMNCYCFPYFYYTVNCTSNYTPIPPTGQFTHVWTVYIESSMECACKPAEIGNIGPVIFIGPVTFIGPSNEIILCFIKKE